MLRRWRAGLRERRVLKVEGFGGKDEVKVRWCVQCYGEVL